MLERVRGAGLLLAADPHVAATPPGQRLEGYREQVLAKLAACLAHAADNDLVPVILGDLFHWPRENPNALLVELIGLFAAHRPFVLVGNHDKYLARFTPDVSLAVLDAAGCVRLMAEPGPRFVLETPDGKVLVGASPDGSPIPQRFDIDLGLDPGAGYAQVLWLTHHNLSFPDFPEKQHRLRDIPGVDWVINGHIHRPQPTLTIGSTRWANPGNLTRLTFSRRTMGRVPAAAVWRPGCADLERWKVPHLPFAEVFPDQEFPSEEHTGEDSESLFVQGLERLAWRRTQEGLGLAQFLQDHLDPELPETELIWELYEEVVGEKRH